tara:strand:+ start:330 stop:563 length:234 start_codon:yes stop_codon:yes gene_type:complete
MLSPKVKESLEEAQSHLRNALAHSARTEKPIINKQIAEIMTAIDYLMKMEEVSDRIDAIATKINKDSDGNSFLGGLF